MKNKLKKQFKEGDVMDFLRESNAIEGVYSPLALVDAKEAWDFLAEQPELTAPAILETHKILMKNRNLDESEKGYFRRAPVWIGGHEGLNFLKIPEAIDSWLLDVETSLKIPGKDGENIRLDHIEYERIHGFIDGNGRTGRMFMNWQRGKVGLPLLIIHADWPNDPGEQRSYYSWFKS